ncbi:chemotaxis protein CheW [Erythrobacter sp. SCSIO 43205]|uniref:chemotaxis protein CheW n=1 Tax=Erythrobacter sp. SCSIO 43205 TaxID=2779361 RepID=UPI001CA80AD7|nr:chemotaxis protein CheW [Erythrobacter sp. SCSIO 43205]UAB77965.1 chemotaxis protein CheW [Erythrobacter sp. SCSIO 43205]
MNTLLVMAQIAGRRCAIEAPNVDAVIEIGAITPVPRTPEYISGITAMRSQALTVIDARTALGFDQTAFPVDHRAIVASLNGDLYAFRVDIIEDVCTAMSEPETVPGGFGEGWTQVSPGLVETRVGPALLLNLSALLCPAKPFEAAA